MHSAFASGNTMDNHVGVILNVDSWLTSHSEEMSKNDVSLEKLSSLALRAQRLWVASCMSEWASLFAECETFDIACDTSREETLSRKAQDISSLRVLAAKCQHSAIALSEVRDCLRLLPEVRKARAQPDGITRELAIGIASLGSFHGIQTWWKHMMTTHSEVSAKLELDMNRVVSTYAKCVGAYADSVIERDTNEDRAKSYAAFQVPWWR